MNPRAKTCHLRTAVHMLLQVRPFVQQLLSPRFRCHPEDACAHCLLVKTFEELAVGNAPLSYSAQADLNQAEETSQRFASSGSRGGAIEVTIANSNGKESQASLGKQRQPDLIQMTPKLVARVEGNAERVEVTLGLNRLSLPNHPKVVQGQRLLHQRRTLLLLLCV